MEELGSESFFKAVPDWNQKPVEATFHEHAKEMHSTGR
jgi:hypothetical protein